MRGGALFRQLFDLSPVGTVLVSPDFRFLQCNEAFCRYLGYQEPELVGRHFLDVTYPDDREVGAKEIQAVLAGDLDAARVEKRYLHKSGKVVWGEACFGLVREANGRPAHFVTLVLDITERKRTEERLRASEERFRNILEHAPMSMAIVGMDGTIEYINRKARTTFGYSPEDIPTMEHWWVLAYPDPSYRREVVATWTGLTEKALAEHHEIERGEYRVTCKDGTVKTMLILGVPVADKVFVMFEDITERKRAEEALREADRRKNEFLGVLSHELRNPLTPIRNSLYILERAAPGGEQARRAHAVIDRQVEHLTRLVDDLLDVTRITRGKIRLQRARLDLVDAGAPHRRGPPHPPRGPRGRRRAAGRGGLGRRRPDAAGPGDRQPAQQRGQVHRRGREGLGVAHAGRGARGAGGRRHRDWASTRRRSRGSSSRSRRPTAASTGAAAGWGWGWRS